MKAILLVYDFVSGEERYTAKKLLKVSEGEDPEQAANRWLHDMWGENTHADSDREGRFWNLMETVYVETEGIQEVRPEDEGVLQRYGI